MPSSSRQHRQAVFLFVALGCLGIASILLETKSLNVYSVRFGSSESSGCEAGGSVRHGTPAASKDPPALVDLNKLCPALVQQQQQVSKPASNTTLASAPLPPRELLSHAEIQEVIGFWYRFQCPPKPPDPDPIVAKTADGSPVDSPIQSNSKKDKDKVHEASTSLSKKEKKKTKKSKSTKSTKSTDYEPSCKIEGLSQHLLHAAHRANKSLLTVQVGANDGTTNDPMYHIFVPGHRLYQKHLPTVNRHAEAAARHWLPVLFEPVPSNLARLTEHYSGLAEQFGICSRPVHAAVSFEAGGNGRCAFCRINTRDDAPETCKKLPDWKKYQIGSLDCDYHKYYFKERFDLCVLRDPLPCGVLGDLLKEQAGLDARTAPLAILQIDIEGYEYRLLQNYLSSNAALPYAIHYEHKVMLDLDKKMPLNGTQTRNQITEDLLRSKGYTLWLEGEDVLALRL